MIDFTETKRALLAECADDYVGLWAVIGYVADEMPEESEDEIREATIDVIYELLKSEQIEAGFPDPGGVEFYVHPFPAHVIIKKIDSEWKSLGRRPNAGEIAWFTSRTHK